MKIEKPYYAVIFSSTVSENDEGYENTAKLMIELAEKQPGFLGIETARNEKDGITVSYWDSEESIQKWKEQADHQMAQTKGRDVWYDQYHLRVARVEREYTFQRSE